MPLLAPLPLANPLPHRPPRPLLFPDKLYSSPSSDYWNYDLPPRPLPLPLTPKLDLWCGVYCP